MQDALLNAKWQYISQMEKFSPFTFIFAKVPLGEVLSTRYIRRQASTVKAVKSDFLETILLVEDTALRCTSCSEGQ